MQRLTTTSFGRRPLSAAQLEAVTRLDRPAPVASMDKWELLTQLTAARESYELSDRTLRVLAVLLGVHRERELTDGAPLIVYASNATLCERAHGMPESTLRRHLAALVASGLIARHDSPNGKRYQRRDASGAVVRAYGFDLRPLLLRAGEIAHHARAAEIRSNEIALLREEVVLLIRDASDLAQLGHASELDEGLDAIEDAVILAKRQLRRKLGLEDLSTIRDRLQPLVATLVEKLTPEVEPTDPVTPELIASDSQNERHIQNADIIHSDSEGQGTCTPERSQPFESNEAEKDQSVSLGQVLSTCKEHQSFFPEPLRNWADVERISDKIAPMLGIDQPVMIDAKRVMGREAAAITILCMLEKAAVIRSPGAYLRRLTQMARDGAFSLKPMVMALANREIVS